MPEARPEMNRGSREEAILAKIAVIRESLRGDKHAIVGGGLCIAVGMVARELGAKGILESCAAPVGVLITVIMGISAIEDLESLNSALAEAVFLHIDPGKWR